MTPMQKKTGLKHLCAAIIYAGDGFRVLTKESAFRHEVIFLFAVLGLFVFFNVSFDKYLIAVMLWLIIIAFEAINTAIEHIVDKISPEISDFAKHTKDLASFAVFCTSSINVLFVVYVLMCA